MENPKREVRIPPLEEQEARGRKQGLKEGRVQGALSILLSLVNDGTLPIGVAVAQAERRLAAEDDAERTDIPEKGVSMLTIFEIMGNRCLVEARRKGRVMGGLDMLVNLVVDGLLPADAAAAKAGMDEVRFRAVVAMIAANKP